MVTPAEVMVVTPHPDDAEIGAGGTVARWIGEGKRVVYVVCTNGNKGSADPEMQPEKLAAIREEEQRAAAWSLGVAEVVFLRHPDQSLEDTIEFRKELVRLIRRYRPHTVLTCDPYQRYFWWHRDHRITGRVTLDAIFPCARDFHSFPELLEEGLQPHKVSEVLLWGSEEPNYRSDVTATFAAKMAALSCHRSQIGDKIAPELEKRFIEWHRTMAEGEDFELGEAFHRVDMWW
jgi:LmbE family N-acetylglucosaminyl deacetylase